MSTVCKATSNAIQCSPLIHVHTFPEMYVHVHTILPEMYGLYVQVCRKCMPEMYVHVRTILFQWMKNPLKV
jgi:hypothetical protein